LAIVNNADLRLDAVTGFSSDYFFRRTYQLDNFHIKSEKATASERLEPFPRIRHKFLRLISYFIPFKYRNYVKERTMEFDARILNLKVNGNLYLDGYWQSEKYFKDIENVIRGDLKIKLPCDDMNLKMCERIRNLCAVALHVRFFESISNIGLNNISQNYYIKAIERMTQLVPNAHYFIFSDNPIEARKVIDLPAEKMTFISHNKSENNAYCDLWLMSKCQHFIIANSTFSWWGAWLASNKNKIVIVPGEILNKSQTSWGFRGLIPDEWIRI
jgi:hypothetical protein